MKLHKLIAAIFIFGFIACQNKQVKQEKQLSVDQRLNQLFQRDFGGTTGADGTISVLMPDGSSVFMMGDSFLGEVIEGKRDSTTKMINNTFIVVDPEVKSSETLYQGECDDPESFVIPENDPGRFYWPGHGFVQDSIFHFFMSRFWINGAEMWGFKFVNTDYFKYSWPDFELISVEPFEYSLINGVHWGHAVLDDGEYKYIYGSKPGEDNICNAHVCRTKVLAQKSLDLENVEFYDGEQWSNDPESTKPMLGTSSNISEQFSVFKYQDKYVLLSQQRGIGAGEIYTYIADSPFGPWRNKQMVYRTTETESDNDIITYNAMAHPQYIEDGKLVICYNVNSLKISKVFEDVNNYRPVFLRVELAQIMGEKSKD
ncbi:hypothetical protein ACUNWD_09920 [Sunxiuqinia sp. A32]|uniref:hypothetical protein n=1 Tax=Sunxiuqinia sp. A32 TaxID=3461496 RepID=UPI0040462835